MVTYANVLAWVQDKLDNTTEDIDQIESEFIEEFGFDRLSLFHDAIDEAMEY